MNGGRPELVGRDRELTALTAALAAVADGEPRLVLCSGEPGSGKTRLAEELAKLGVQRGVAVIWGRCAEAEGAPPYWVWRQVLGGLAERAAPGPDLEPLLADGRLAAARSGGPDERFRVFDAMAGYLRAATADAPLVVVLDDLHWADEPSLLLLGHLGRGLTAGRLLLLVTYRETELADGHPLGPLLVELTRYPRTERIELAGLPRDAVARYLRDITRSEVAGRTVERVHEITGGNPFFIGELGRTLAERNGEVGIPVSVREAIRARVDRLAPASRNVLRAASIVGRQFPATVVAEMLDRPVLDTFQPLDEAVAAGLVERTEITGEHRFTHALVRDGVEAGMPTADRVRLHRAAARAIEVHYAKRLEPHLSDLARHWASAAVLGERGLAATWARRAGDEAIRRLAFEEGVRLYRQAVEVGAEEWPDLERFEVLRALADALHRSGDLRAALPVALQAAELARRIDRPDLVGAVALILDPSGHAPWDRAAQEMCTEALRGLPTDSAPLRVRLLARLAESSVYQLEMGAAERLSAEALHLAERSNDSEVLVAALRARQLARIRPEGHDDRVVIAERMLQVGRALNDPVTQMWAYLWRIDTHLEIGDLPAVGADLGPLQAWVERVRGPIARWHLVKAQATLAQAQARFADALRFADEAMAILSAAGHPAAQPGHFPLRALVGRHVGYESVGLLNLVPGYRATGVPDHFTIFDTVGLAAVFADAGQQEQAVRRYRQAGPMSGWPVAPFFEIVLYGLAINAAIALDERDDLAALHQKLTRHRGRHVVVTAGSATYGGPVELALGMAASHLGRYDESVADLESAVAICDRNGAVGFAAEARYHLAAALVARQHGGDRPRARQLLVRARRESVALGADRITGLIDRLNAALQAAQSTAPLSRREAEIAALVAQGMTNRQIAAELVLSERTVETHVQNTLHKLGFANRSQIAAWVVSR